MLRRLWNWLRNLFGTRQEADGSAVPILPEAPHRPRAQHTLTPKQWKRRKARMRMVRESRRRNRT